MILPVAPPKVAFRSNFAPNSIVIDSGGRSLYYVLSATEAYQYPISVGREGFSWSGTEVISRQQAWPDWHPPKEMIARDPRLPDKMTGGLKNPLGALALYLGNTLYRIHGTNDPKSIGRAASSGCFRMMNENVLHLASLAKVGTPVTVVKQLPNQMVAARPSRPPVVEAAPEEDPFAREEPRRDLEGDYEDPRLYEPYDRDERLRPLRRPAVEVTPSGSRTEAACGGRRCARRLQRKGGAGRGPLRSEADFLRLIADVRYGPKAATRRAHAGADGCSACRPVVAPRRSLGDCSRRKIVDKRERRVNRQDAEPMIPSTLRQSRRVARRSRRIVLRRLPLGVDQAKDTTPPCKRFLTREHDAGRYRRLPPVFPYPLADRLVGFVLAKALL